MLLCPLKTRESIETHAQENHISIHSRPNHPDLSTGRICIYFYPAPLPIFKAYRADSYPQRQLTQCSRLVGQFKREHASYYLAHEPFIFDFTHLFATQR